MPSKIPYHKPHGPPQADRSQSAIDRKRFYDRAAWRKLRAVKLAQDPVCELCLKADRISPAVHVHHLQKLETRPDLALDLANLESLCHPCHSALHAKERPRS